MLKLSVAAKAPLSTQFIIYPLYPHPLPSILSLSHSLMKASESLPQNVHFAGAITHTRSANLNYLLTTAGYMIHQLQIKKKKTFTLKHSQKGQHTPLTLASCMQNCTLTVARWLINLSVELNNNLRN